MYAANSIPVDRAATLPAGESVALAGFTFALTCLGVVAGGPLALVRYGSTLELLATRALPSGGARSGS